MKPLRVLHTADWHLGRSLFQKNRHAEFEKFLGWMIETLDSQSIDVLLVAGDIFDTTTPSNSMQGLYYDFLVKVAQTNCKHVVITSGNHDSPSLLDIPKELLKRMDIHVVGEMPDKIEEEVIVLYDESKQPQLIVCAVPYLRDRDIRKAAPGESIETKEANLRDGIRQHYAQVAQIAQAKQKQLNATVPVVAMGHLFTAGGETVDGDGVRSLYVGTLAHVDSSIFPDCFDYVALGHLHVPQCVNQSETIRFSGSPIPMGFGEATQQKYVNIVQWNGPKPTVEMLPIPKFQQLQTLLGDWQQIQLKLDELKATTESYWVDVTYEDTEIIANLKEKVDQLVKGSAVEVLKVTNKRISTEILQRENQTESLKDLKPIDVFDRILANQQIPDEQKKNLRDAFLELELIMQQADPNAS